MKINYRLPNQNMFFPVDPKMLRKYSIVIAVLISCCSFPGVAQSASPQTQPVANHVSPSTPVSSNINASNNTDSALQTSQTNNSANANNNSNPNNNQAVNNSQTSTKNSSIVSTATKPNSIAQIANLLGGLALILVLIFGLSWFVKRFSQGGFSQNSSIKMLSAMPLGTRERLMLVEVGNKQMLLGVTATQINNLYVFDEPVVNNNKIGNHTNPSDFSQKLMAILQQKNTLNPNSPASDNRNQ